MDPNKMDRKRKAELSGEIVIFRLNFPLMVTSVTTSMAHTMSRPQNLAYSS